MRHTRLGRRVSLGTIRCMIRATSGVDELTRVELFGFDFVDDVSVEPIADIIVGSRPDQVAFPPVVVTPNTDLLLQLSSDSDDRLRTFFSHAWCVLPDGQPIVFRRVRQFYLAPDVDLARFPPAGSTGRMLLGASQFIKLPSPSLEFNARDGWRWHPVRAAVD